MAETDELPGSGRIGRYLVRRRLGAGGVGVVYAAHDPSLDREVAVKLVRADRLRGNKSAASEHLRREARITAKLAHPNVVTVFDVGEHEGSVFLAMELVHGPPLNAWVREQARPWREVLAMFFQAGLGLAAAHDAGLIHRDFKPGNVLVGDRRARVVDFGLAHFGAVEARPVGGPDPRETLEGAIEELRDLSTTEPGPARGEPADSGVMSGQLLTTTTVDGPEASLRAGLITDLTVTHSTLPGGDESLAGVTFAGNAPETFGTDMTSTGVFVGTPAYMAPELFSGGGADARTDQFAFCVSLYEALYGERPFAGENARDLAHEVLAGNIKEPPARSRVPRWVRALVVRGLAVDPAARHPSMRSMLASIAFTAKIMFE